MQRHRRAGMGARLRPLLGSTLGSTPLPVPAVGCILLVMAMVGATLGATAEATPLSTLSPAASTWLNTTAAQALQVAEAQESLSAGGFAALNMALDTALDGGLDSVRQAGPAWLRNLDLGIELREHLPARYALSARYPLRPDALWLEARAAHDPIGSSRAQLGIRRRHHQMTIGIDITLEDRAQQRQRRVSLGTEVRLPTFDLSIRLFDDVATGTVAGGSSDGRLNGYDVALGIQPSVLPWARIEAQRSWHRGIRSVRPTTQDRAALRLHPLAPVEVEVGAKRQDDVLTWFARIGVALRFGAPS